MKKTSLISIGAAILGLILLIVGISQNNSLEAQLAAEVRHQVAAFMERRGMGGLIRGGR